MILALSLAAVVAAQAKVDVDTLRPSGLRAPVEVRYDRWGVPHIYARNQHDLVLLRCQRPRQVPSDKSRSTGDRNFHCFKDSTPVSVPGVRHVRFEN